MNRVCSFLCKFKLINPKQFRHTLVSLTETIKCDLYNGLYVCVIFVDLQKTFDVIDHEILQTKLSFYGIRGLENKWFRSFLTPRKQYVSISVFLSGTKIVQGSVPQGSNLEPLLF